MNRSLIFLLLGLAVSCQVVSLQDEQMSPFKLTAGNSDAKSCLNEVADVIWEKGDAIAVFFNGAPIPVTTGEYGKVVNFLGNVPEGDSFYMLYPWRNDAAISSNVIRSVIPTVQETPLGSFARGANVSAAISSKTDSGLSHEATFYNVGAYMRITVSAGNVSRVVIRSLGGETLTGEIDVHVVSKTNIFASGGQRDSVVVKPAGNAACFAPGAYYAVVLPGQLSSGLRISVYHSDDTPEHYNFDGAVTLSKNVILNISSPLGRNLWNGWTDAASLKALLAKAPAKGKVYTSQHLYYNYANIDNINTGRYSWYGGYPLMYGVDFSTMTGKFYEYGSRTKHKTFFLRIAQAAWAMNRSIPVASWHLESPYASPENPELDGVLPCRFCYQNRSDYPSFPSEHRWQVNEILNNTGSAITGQTCGDWFDDRVREVAEIINQLVDPSGAPIPIIFRLWHELEDWWAWWQIHDIQDGQYAAFYRLTVNKFREYCPGHPILFVYCTDKYSSESGDSYLAQYPGDAYVDILGYDDYTIGTDYDLISMSITRARVVSAAARSHGKLSMLCETLRSAKDATRYQDIFFQDFVTPIVTDSNTSLSIFQCWGGADNTDARKTSFAWWYNSEMTIFNK